MVTALPVNKDEFGNPIGSNVEFCPRCGGYGGIIASDALFHGEPDWQSCPDCSGKPIKKKEN